MKYTIKGTFVSGSQYHFTLEPQCCLCIPLEDELDVFVTTQFITFTQRNMAVCLGIPENRSFYFSIFQPKKFNKIITYNNV